jgi:hypothetical protein
MRVLFTIISACVLAVFTSCEFSESLILNEDGSGKIKIQMDASEILTLISSMGDDTELKGMEESLDTTFYFADILKQRKDSIAKLPQEQQEKLQKLEAFGVHIKMDAEKGDMVYEVFLNFKDISEANDMFKVFNQISDTGTNTVNSSEGLPKQESIKVRYSFQNNIFKRDAFISDKILHLQELDSLQSMEMMMGNTIYKLNYTFPKKIKSVSNSDATFSADRKTIYLQVNYFDYFRDPDLLSVEVVLD